MPSKHSKNAGDRGFQTYTETHHGGFGTMHQRVSGDSQLPFGHCALSLTPIDDAVVSPSGRLYSREAILDYLLQKTQEIKKLTRDYERQQVTDSTYRLLQQARTEQVKYITLSFKEILSRESVQAELNEQDRLVKAFTDNQDGVVTVLGKRPGTERTMDDIQKTDLLSNLKKTDRKRAIDDRERETKMAELQAISPWIPQFTPAAKSSALLLPPKRPLSPFSGRPLRTKDLIPIDLLRDNANASAGTAGITRFACPVSLKTITTQKVIVIKTTRTYMIESVAEQLAFKSMTCPITGKRFAMDDVIHLTPAASGFAASGKVEATKYRPNKN